MPTNADQVTFRTTFSEDVAMVDPSGITEVSLSAGILTIQGSDSGAQLTLVIVGGNLRVTDPNHTSQAGAGATQVDPNTIEIPLINLTDSIVINGEDGEDTLTIDFGGGNLPVSLSFTGGLPDTAPGDKLEFVGGAGFSSVDYTFTNVPGSGSVDFSGAPLIEFTGLE